MEYQTLTDEKYNELIENLSSLSCSIQSCTGNHLELEMSDLGWDTVVDRSGNKVVITSYNLFGRGFKATKADKKEIKAKYKQDGWTCN